MNKAFRHADLVLLGVSYGAKETVEYLAQRLSPSAFRNLLRVCLLLELSCVEL